MRYLEALGGGRRGLELNSEAKWGDWCGGMRTQLVAAWFERHGRRIAQAFAFLGCAGLHTLAFPPFETPEAAFVFLVPLLLWLRLGPSGKQVFWTALPAFWVSWLVLIFWLRHVTFAGMVALAGVVALHQAAFCLGAWWLTRRLARDGDWRGLPWALGVAGLWVASEHVRSWLFTGFPWLPLAASQWDRPFMLQSAAFLGSWGVSFALALLNAGLAAYLVRLAGYARSRRKGVCLEFYLSLAVLVGLTFLLARLAAGQQREPLLKAGVVQPAIPQDRKWDEAFARSILSRVERYTLFLKPLRPDAVFWPEASLPYPVMGDPGMRAWLEDLATRLERPVLAGALAVEGEDEEGGERWRNSVFMARPQWGLHPTYYSKRHLVPFGEYIPLRPLWPWMEKFVPIGGDFTPGEKPALIPLVLPERTIRIGALICYEDVFPRLARESTLAGASVLFVATNSAWYGRSAAAAQHRAHSILRAVENRRVVLRVGNDGWSGWIDEFGNIRGSFDMWEIGSTVFDIDRDRRWIGRETFYTRHGDWFAWLSWALAAACAGFGLRWPAGPPKG